MHQANQTCPARPIQTRPRQGALMGQEANMETKSITATAGITSSHDYQTVRYDFAEGAIMHIAGKGMVAN